jgi:hypothetical protein
MEERFRHDGIILGKSMMAWLSNRGKPLCKMSVQIAMSIVDDVVCFSKIYSKNQEDLYDHW